MLRLGELLFWFVMSLSVVASTEAFMAFSRRLRTDALPQGLRTIHSWIRVVGYGALLVDGVLILIFPRSAAWEAAIVIAVLVASAVGVARVVTDLRR